MAEAPNLSKLVPGFDFLQSLVKGAGSALPGIGNWVAPTLNPEEIEKRIEELRTVQFWLEQYWLGQNRLLQISLNELSSNAYVLSKRLSMHFEPSFFDLSRSC